jgi:hypothetical protein
MLKYTFISILAIFLLGGCAIKKPIQTKSATILFKTPKLKFYDKGFIKRYDDYIDLNILNAGQSVFALKIYKDEICQSSFKCLNSKTFNKEFLNESYPEDFLYKLFLKSKVYFKDKKNRVLIKVISDK